MRLGAEGGETTEGRGTGGGFTSTVAVGLTPSPAAVFSVWRLAAATAPSS